MFDPDLPSNRLIYEVRRKPEVFRTLADRLEEVMSAYGLSEDEKAAWRVLDIQKLAALGVHSYFLPQVTRLLRGSANNDSRSEAAQAYRKSMVGASQS